MVCIKKDDCIMSKNNNSLCKRWIKGGCVRWWKKKETLRYIKNLKIFLCLGNEGV